jgi:hypothetical protein
MRAVSVQAKFYGVVIEYMILKRSALGIRPQFDRRATRAVAPAFR